jgi:oligopeptide transport system substrate-binding protein
MRYDVSQLHNRIRASWGRHRMRRHLSSVVNRSGFVLSVLVLLALGSLLPGLTAEALQSAGSRIYRVNWGDPFPETLDPQHSDQGQWSVSGGLDWEGLTRIDEELQVVPGAAESWEFSPDGTAITFHLRAGLVFSDGVPVIAEHFRYAAERLCSPELNSRSSSNLFDVIGCEDLFNAKSAADEAAAKARFGVRALDDRTVEYRFIRPAPYFPEVGANWAAIPLRQELIEAGGPDWWTNPATRIGNGPFRLVEFESTDPNQHLLYARNDHYWGGRTKLDALEFLFLDLADPATLEAYRHGDFDETAPESADFPAIEADPILSRELVTIPVTGTRYFQYNLSKEPFQDEKVREAFAYAFDREAYCRDLSYGACRPALSMVSPGAPGSIETDAFAFDPEKARQALAKSSYGGPEGLPEITWYGWKDPSGAPDAQAEWLYQQFRQVLGVEMTMVYLPDDELDALFDDPATVPQFHESTWWIGPGPDPRDWFIIWRCTSTFDSGENYCNPELDALLDRADAEMDPDKRLALYEDAGRMLVADAPAIFVNTEYITRLVKPYVTGYSRAVIINGDWPGWMNLMTLDVERPE